MGSGAHVESSNPLFNAILARSFMDLHMLRMRQQDQVFFAAGVPWYVALFGRDSLITALEVLAFEPESRPTPCVCWPATRRHGSTTSATQQPGKILHELRVDEMANLHEVPQTPYYGSVDSTPLFLVLLGRHADWTGTLDLFHELHENVRAALEWIDRFGDADGDGFIDYQTRSSNGGRNQGWKDSGNGVVMQNGSLAEPPIALPEVQGNVYLAWRCMAELYERDGDAVTAQHLREHAQDLTHASTASSGCRENAISRFAGRKIVVSPGVSPPTRPMRCGPALSIRGARPTWWSVSCVRICSADGVSVRCPPRTARTIRWTTSWAASGRTTMR